MTYAELDERARRIATELRLLGVGPGILVGLCCRRGPGLIAAMLGILAAGGAYVPVDPAYPAERIDHLVSDSGIRVAVGPGDAESGGPAAERLAAAGVRVVSDEPDEPDKPDKPAEVAEMTEPVAPAGTRRPERTDPAYVIYTSGSTGTPKGVVVEHGSVLRLLSVSAEVFGFDEHDVWTWFHSASFDFSVWEIWGALAFGGTLVVVPETAVRLPAVFAALLDAEGVTVLNQTPSAFRQLLTAVCPDSDSSGSSGTSDPSAPALPALRLVVFGGERLDPGLLRPWFRRFGQARPRLVNMFGITETTVHVTHRTLGVADAERPGHSPIGVPLADLRVTLHDPAGAQVPDGVPGEMWVSGPGVARGYLGRPELTAERFVTGADGRRAYRSGDLAVRAASGELEVLGRVDDQIKVRGFRIEPFEIESVLAGHPEVAAVVVTPRDHGDGDVYLVAHVQPAGLSSTPDSPDALRLAEDLRAHAAARLPAHLRPSVYELLKELPMTQHGKVDRAVLRREPAADAIDAIDAIDKDVARIAEEVLSRGPLPGDRDLFDLGVTSLAFVRIIAQANTEFGITLTGAELGEVASLDHLAAAVRAAVGTAGADAS